MRCMGWLGLLLCCTIAALVHGDVSHEAQSSVESIAYPTDTIERVNGVLEVGEPNYNFFEKNHPVRLINFHIPWCRHCKQFGPVFDRLAPRLEAAVPGMAVAKVDIAHWKQLSKRFGVERAPTVQLHWGSPMKKAAYEYKGEGDAEYEQIISWLLDTLDGEAVVMDEAALLQDVDDDADDWLDDRTAVLLLWTTASLLFLAGLYCCARLRRATGSGSAEDEGSKHKASNRRPKTITTDSEHKKAD